MRRNSRGTRRGYRVDAGCIRYANAKFPVARSRNVPPFSIRRDFCRDYRAERCTKMVDAMVEIPDVSQAVALRFQIREINGHERSTIFQDFHLRLVKYKSFNRYAVIRALREVYARVVGEITDRLATCLKV